MPTRQAGPLAIALGPDGLIWFTESNSSKVASLNPKTKVVKEFQLSTTGIEMWGITVAGGYVWYTEYQSQTGVGKIGRLDPTNGSLTEFSVPTPRSFPLQVVVSDSGEVWFTEFGGNKIGRLDPAKKVIEEFAVPSADSGPAGLVIDGRGRIWFTEGLKGKIAVLEPSAKSVTEYAPPSEFQIFSPVGIGIEPRDGSVWVADHGGNWIIKFEPSKGVWKKFHTSQPPPEVYPVSIPNGLAIDHSGIVWFTEHGGNKIGRLDPRTETIVEYHIPTGPVSTVFWLALDDSGNVWFTEFDGNKIGVVDGTKQISFDLQSSGRNLAVQAGTAGFVEISVNRKAGRDSTLSLGLSTDVAKISVSYAPNRLLGPSDSKAKIEINIASDAKPGSYSALVTASDGTITLGVSIGLTVSEASPLTGLLGQWPLVLGIIGLGLVVSWLAWRRREAVSIDSKP